jgi:hypothetical protein
MLSRICQGFFEDLGLGLSNAGIERIDVYVDGKFAASSQIGVSRPDIKSAYSKYRDNGNSGFDFPVDLSGKSAGTHELTVQGRSKDGAVRELYRYPINCRTLTITKFDC